MAQLAQAPQLAPALQHINMHTSTSISLIHEDDDFSAGNLGSMLLNVLQLHQGHLINCYVSYQTKLQLQVLDGCELV